MPFKRGESYYVDLSLPGYPHRIARSTEQGSKRLAQQMEATLRNLATSGRHDALDALEQKRISLPDLHSAYVAGRLDELIEEQDDPRLVDIVEDFKELTTQKNYEYNCNRLLRVAPDDARASWLLDHRNIQKLADLYAKEGLSPATERREMPAVGIIIRRQFGEDERRRVFGEVNLRTVNDRKVRYLTPDEIRRLKQNAGPWWRVILLALSTGIRKGELLALRRKDVDLDRGLLIVEEGKSDQARRPIPLTGNVRDMLERWLDSTDGDDDDPLFPGLSTWKLRRSWYDIREQAGVDKRWHDLRHTFAVHCAKAGMPIRELQKRMGHSQITTTEKYMDYAPPTKSEYQADAMSNMGLNGGG